MLSQELLSLWLPGSRARMLHVSDYVCELRPRSSPKGEEQLRSNQNPSHAGLYRSQSAAWITPKADWHSQCSALPGAVCSTEPTPLSRQVLGLELLGLLGDLLKLDSHLQTAPWGPVLPCTGEARFRESPSTAVTDSGVFCLAGSVVSKYLYYLPVSI